MTNEEKKNTLKTIINGVIDAFFETEDFQDKQPTQPEPQKPTKESQKPVIRGLMGKSPNIPPSTIGPVELHCGDITPMDEDKNKISILNLKRIFEWGLENSLVERYANVSRGIIMLDRTIMDICVYDQIEVFVKVDDGSATIVTGLESLTGELRTQALDIPIIVYSRLPEDMRNDRYEPMNMACIIPINNFNLKLINQYYKAENTVTDIVEKKNTEYVETVSSAIQDYRHKMDDIMNKSWGRS